MKRLILIISLVLVLGANGLGLGLPLQADTEGQLANKLIMESGIQNSSPKSLTITRGRTAFSPLNHPTTHDSLRQRDSTGSFLPTEEDSRSSRTDRIEKGLCSSDDVLLKWDNSTAHDIFYLYGGADQAVWDTTLDLYGAPPEYTNETFSDAYFDSVTAAIIPMFNRGTIITPAEALAVKTFVDAGGRVLLCGYWLKEFWNYFSENGTNLIAEQFGVSFAVTEGTWEENNYTTVRDPVNNYGQTHEVNITNFESHPITTGVTEWYLRGPSLEVTNPDVKILAKGSLGAYYNTTPTDWINDTDIVHLAVLENEQGGGILFSAGAYLLRHAYTTQHGTTYGYNGSKLVDNVARWLLGIHDPISIANDGDFSTQAAYENWPGDGSMSTPYVIAGFRITDPMGSLIAISGTTIHFRIANNYLNGLNGAHEGIHFSNVIYGTIESNIICNNSGPHSGITLEVASTSYNRIINNTIYDNGMGIIVGGNNNTIANNTIYENEAMGIWLNIGSNNHTVVGNTIYNNDIGQGGRGGLVLEESHNNLIVNNTIGDNPAWLFSSTNNTISNNTLSGLSFDYSNFNTIANNTISGSSGNGIDFGNSSHCLIVNNAISNAENGMYLRGCRHSIIANNTVSYCAINGIDIPCDFDRNIQSYNNTIDANTVHHITEGSIVIGYDGGAHNNTVSNNIVSNGGVHGIILESASNNAIFNNTVREYGGDGILLSSSDNNLVTNNRIYESSNPDWSAGIDLSFSNSNTVVRNQVYNTRGVGIHLRPASYNLVSNNTVDQSGHQGIFIGESEFNTLTGNNVTRSQLPAIILHASHYHTLSGNNVSHNNMHGIWLEMADHNLILHNVIQDNGGHGIGLGAWWNGQRQTSDNNSVVGNMFLGNDAEGDPGGEQAWDTGVSNSWDNSTHGNWWSDYTGADWDQDGIGDSPYAIPGDSGAQDRYPLILLTATIPDTTPPTINAPPDVSYAEGTTGHFLAWEATDTHPSWYNITRDGTLVAERVWNAVEISITIDGLAVGLYTYTLTVYDQHGNSASDSVLVTVTAPVTASFETERTDESKESSATTPGFTVSVLLLVGIAFLLGREWMRRNQRRS